jgi:hypothetical protein
MIEDQELAELLGRPFGSRMLRDVAVKNTPRVDLHSNEHIHDPKSSRDGNEEVTGNDALGMVPDKSASGLPATVSNDFRRGVKRPV